MRPTDNYRNPGFPAFEVSQVPIFPIVAVLLAQLCIPLKNQKCKFALLIKFQKILTNRVILLHIFFHKFWRLLTTDGRSLGYCRRWLEQWWMLLLDLGENCLKVEFFNFLKLLKKWKIWNFQLLVDFLKSEFLKNQSNQFFLREPLNCFSDNFFR